MSGFDLVPVDGGDRVHVPPGETQLGRGPFLGVSDKRVSRHHALLDNQSRRLRLKPTHLNPCFVQTSLSDDPRPLRRDEWHPLSHGDLFSLLPGHLIYRVEAAGGEDGSTPRNSQMFEDEAEPPISPEPDDQPPAPTVHSIETTPPTEKAAPPTEKAAPPTEKAAPPIEEAAPPTEKAATTGLGRSLKKMVSKPQEASPPCKTRVLPAWMMAVVSAPPTSSSRSKAVKRSKEPAASTSVKQATPTTTPTPERAELSEEEEEPRKRKRKRRRKSEEEEEVESKTVETSVPETGTRRRRRSEGAWPHIPRALTQSSKGQRRESRLPAARHPDSERHVPTEETATGRTRSTSRSAVTPAIPTTRRKRRRMKRTDPNAPTEPTATGKTLFTGRSTNTHAGQLAPRGPRPKRLPAAMTRRRKSRTLGTTASSTTTARTAVATQTTSRPLTQTRGGGRTWRRCGGRPRTS